MKIKEFTGKTTKEAIDNGLAELGVTIADVHVDVLLVSYTHLTLPTT